MSAARLDVVRLARRRRRARVAGDGEGIVFIDQPDCLLRARVLAQRPTSRPTLVIVPDAPNAIEHYDALIARLGRSANVVCIEAPGSGFSFPKGDYDFRVERIAAALRAALEHLDLGPYVLIAPCGGTYPAIRLANRSPDLIVGLGIVQAAGWEEEKRWIRRIDPKRQMSRPLVGQAICGLTSSRLSDTWYQAALAPDTPKDPFKATSRDVLERGGCFCLASLIQANRDAEPDLDPVTQPTFILWGARDRTHARTERRSSLALAPDAHFVEFPDAGHSPDLEEEARFADLALALAAETGP
jgi:pimeloyl-ACP methyl ester carboxylesterase